MEGATHRIEGATFPVLRFQDLDDLTEPGPAGVDTARQRLDELDSELVMEGWHREERTGRHWWSRRYVRGAR